MSNKAIQMTDGNNNVMPICAEYGSNSNGNYVKFADGTLIVFMKVSLPNGSQTGQQLFTKTLPASFVDTNYVILGIIQDSLRGYSTGVPNVLTYAPATTNTIQLNAHINSAWDNNNVAHVLVIGRWR